MARDILQVSTSSSGKTALRFWEIDSMFRCPVIGICLTGSEQIALLKKAGIPSKDKNSFEIHELLVASAGNKNRLSFRINLFCSRNSESSRLTCILSMKMTCWSIGGNVTGTEIISPLSGASSHVSRRLKKQNMKSSERCTCPCIKWRNYAAA